jgi:hypothetical protein
MIKRNTTELTVFSIHHANLLKKKTPLRKKFGMVVKVSFWKKPQNSVPREPVLSPIKTRMVAAHKIIKLVVMFVYHKKPIAHLIVPNPPL